MSEPTYGETLAQFAALRSWTLRAACDLAVGRLPGTPGSEGPNKEAAALLREAAIGCLVDELKSPQARDLAGMPYTVRPREFARWARKQFPGLLHADFVTHTECFVEPAPVTENKPRKLSERQIAKFRCQGIAAYLWSQKPDEKIAHMAERPELRFGYGNLDTNSRLRKDWIKEVAPSHDSGRPPGKSRSH